MKQSWLPPPPHSHSRSLLPIPSLTLSSLAAYPLLQRSINNLQFKTSGIHNLIVQLRKETMKELKTEFTLNNNNVNIYQFMWLISNSLIVRNMGKEVKDVEEEYYRYEIEYELVRVFEEIDIDNSHSISWEEYIEYITSSSLLEFGEEGLPASGPGGELTYSHREKARFRREGIRKVVEICRLGLLAVVEKGQGGFTFITMEGLAPKFQLQALNHSKVLSLDYCESSRLFGILLSSHYVLFIEDGEIQKLHSENKFLGSEIDIVFLPKHGLWMLISLDGTLQIFSPGVGKNLVATDTTSNGSRKNSCHVNQTLLVFKPHLEDLICSKELHFPLSILTASRNGSIKIWSVGLSQLMVELFPCKEEPFLKCRSIKGIDVYNGDNTTYLLCWMFTSEISVWMPSSSLGKPFVGVLKGHIGIVEEVNFLVNFAIAVSIDSKCCVRVWDVPKRHCLQSWKYESGGLTTKVMGLKSAPYFIFYDKFVEFYRVARERDLIILNQKREIEEYGQNYGSLGQNGTDRESSGSQGTFKVMSSLEKLEKQKSRKNIEDEPLDIRQREIEISQNIEYSDHYSSMPSKLIFKDEINEHFPTHRQPENQEQVIDILFDSYYDCLLVLSLEKLMVIAINTGKVLHRMLAEKGENFVAFCMKENRRFYLSNSSGEIYCVKTEDCSKLYKILPFANSEDENIQEKKKIKSEDKWSKLNKVEDFEIYKIHYNAYNKILLILAECSTASTLITYDCQGCLEPSKKKELIFDQINLVSLVCCEKFNLFYVGSTKPNLVSIWDYHNFTILRCLEIPGIVRSLAVCQEKYNMLVVLEMKGIRVFKIQPVEARNTSIAFDLNLVVGELFIKSEKTLDEAQIVYVKNEGTKRKIKRNRVTFNDEEELKDRENKERKEDGELSDFQGERWEIYVRSGSMALVLNLEKYMKDMIDCHEPSHSDKPNITKEKKRFILNPHPCPSAPLTIQITEITKQNLNQSKKSLLKLGKVNEIVYFINFYHILQFYKPDECKIWAKMSIPKCEVIEWNIFYNLVDKVIERLKKAEAVSKEIYVYKRAEVVDPQKQETMRILFLLNKFFTEEDIPNLKEYLLGIEHERKPIKSRTNLERKSLKIFNLEHEENRKETESQFLEQKYEERSRIRSQAAEKMKEIEKKYSRVLSFIKNKQTFSGEQNKEDFSKTGYQSVGKLQTKTVKRTMSAFKIRGTVSSVNKIHFEHSKEIKNCLAKIGILNSKSKQLKI